jgi:tRNA-dihydrouridine synthase A
MLGRAAYHNPYLLAAADKRFFGAARNPARDEIVRALFPYVEAELSRGTALKHITRHILGLYRSEPGGRIWRRCLSEEAYRPGAGPEVIRRALYRVQVARESAYRRYAA